MFVRQDNSSQSTDAEVGAEARKPRRRLGFWMMIAIIFICLVTDAAGLSPPDGYGGKIYVGPISSGLAIQMAQGAYPLSGKYIFLVCVFSAL